MKNKKIYIIIAIVILVCISFWIGISSILRAKKPPKAEITEDIIINNLNKKSISNLLGKEKLEDDEIENNKENMELKTEDKSEISTVEIEVESGADSDKNIIEDNKDKDSIK